MDKKNVAILLTCYNRKLKTLTCIRDLLQAIKAYGEDKMNYSFFLTDDGCTDGTVEALEERFPKIKIHIIKGNGNLYWAGGMRKAWNEAMKKYAEWDYYLLLNDDVELLPSLFETLFETERYSIQNYGKQGVYSGITRSISNPTKLTYGGHVFTNRFLNKSKHIWSDGTRPVMCDFTNANILMIPRSVVKHIGTFYNGYSHGFADYDYSLKARRRGIPVLLTKDVCGACDFDHPTFKEEAFKIRQMTLSQRIDFYSTPPHRIADFRKFVLRNLPHWYPVVCISTFLNVYFPNLYYRLKGV